jgi:hypothetical protein
MEMTRAEIDLREKIADEIIAAAEITDGKWAMLRAAGLVRQNIWHSSACPCSRCAKFEIKTCSNLGGVHRKITLEEVQQFIEIHSITNGAWVCDWCAGNNEWQITELLWSVEDDFAITPCCHTEATEALDLPEPEDDGQRKEDEQSFRYSVTGNL